MARRLSVVVSQGLGSNPAKRQLEEEIVTGLMFAPGMDVTVIPHLYDLTADSTGMLALRGISGDLVICSWLFDRAAHWILDRNGVAGQKGTTLLVSEDEGDDPEDGEEEPEGDERSRVITTRQLPDRRIYCLDLKSNGAATVFVDEIQRIRKELSVQVVGLGGLAADTVDRFASPGNTTALNREGTGLEENGTDAGAPRGSVNGSDPSAAPVQRIEDASARRWYPVIDYSRCTNCLECIDFCLFGVYGVDRIDTILVEQPDNCRKGCPACSRVCPENAIIFPQHKTPVIAGSAELGASLKIDLSQLFGAPDDGKSAAEMAALERDEQLVLAGRDTVGMQGLEKRQTDQADRPRDELDDLVDQLDELDI